MGGSVCKGRGGRSWSAVLTMATEHSEGPSNLLKVCSYLLNALRHSIAPHARAHNLLHARCSGSSRSALYSPCFLLEHLPLNLPPPPR